MGKTRSSEVQQEPQEKKRRTGPNEHDLSTRSSEDQQEPQEKKRRTGPNEHDLSTGEVEILLNHLGTEGVVLKTTYTSKIEPMSLQQIKNRIQRDQELRIGEIERFDLYPAFKVALLRLLEKIDEALTNDSCQIGIILIHGIPNVGKTSLAECLSYFLALSSGGEKNVNYMQLSHSATVDSNVITKAVTSACHDVYVIVDQVNTNSLIPSEIVSCVKNRLNVARNRMPLIIFTSGHYTPSEKWLNMRKSGMLCYKLITMQIDTSLVDKLKAPRATLQDDVVSNDDLLKVTTCYSRLKKCLDYLEFDDPNAKEDDLRNMVYPGADMQLVHGQSAIHIIWLVWQEFLTNGLPPPDKFTDDNCKMKPHHVGYLGYLISGIKGTRDRGINTLLSLMDVTGDVQYAKNGYIEFEPDSYSLQFLHKARLYNFLKNILAADYSVEKKYKMLLAAFNELTKEGDSQYQYLKDGLFELIIQTICEKETDRRLYRVGMYCVCTGTHAGINFVEVRCQEFVSSEAELCALPHKHERCKNENMTFWCLLNVPGKPAFRGFDFAYLETSHRNNQPVVVNLQMFQATMNPEGKTHENKLVMTDVLDRITNELVQLELIKDSDASKVVMPYFVDPHGGKRSIVLPYRSLGITERSIKAQVVGLPKQCLAA